MAKIKEYPVLILNFMKDLLSGDLKSCVCKFKSSSLYILDKILPADSYIRYSIWKSNNSKMQENSNSTVDVNFLILYFSDGRFDSVAFDKLRRQLNSQLYKNFYIAVIGRDDIQKLLSTGKYTHVGFIEQGDVISDIALDYYAQTISADSSIEIIYSDNDIINRLGVRTCPYFKPEYSPLLLLSHNYMSAFLCLKLNDVLINKLKMVNEINQQILYMLILEITRTQLKIMRIPQVLYHRLWRNAERIDKTSTKDIVLKEIEARQFNAKLLDYKKAGLNQLRFISQNNPRVSIIIPFKDKLNFLKDCINSIESKSTYRNYEIILVNNRSENKATLDYLKASMHRVLDADIDFNFSRLNNMAATVAEGEYLVLLNNDTIVITPEWIENMLAIAELQQVGIVAPKLLYLNNKIQHVGIVLRQGGISMVNSHMRLNDGGYKNYNDLIKEYSCVTGACMMVSKEKYLAVGGFTEELAVEWNDIDFGLKFVKAGYYNVYCPHSVIYHCEAISRKGIYKSFRKNEQNYMYNYWQDKLFNDPFYNPNFSLKRDDFAIRIN